MEHRDLEFDPMDYYDQELAKQIPENAKAYFDDLLEKSKVDEEENKHFITEITKWETKHSHEKSRLNMFNGIRTFLTILIVVALILIALSAFNLYNGGVDDNTAFLVLVIIMPIVLIASILVIFLYLNKKINHYEEVSNKSKEKINKLKQKALNQVAPLVSLFDSSDFINITKKTTKIFSIDPYVDHEKLLMLRELYGFKDEPEVNESIVEVMSGEIETNPYIHVRLFIQRMRNTTYTGSLPISWTERVSDGQGGFRTVVRTETLVASISRPAAYYSDGSYVIYGNEAAPDLTFSRGPSGVNPDMTEKEMRKFESNQEKHLASLAQKSISKGGNFTPLANAKFEGLFGAYDRNHEIQYRLLFTPLAQENMCELILRKKPYKDDFTFYKKKKVNIISSEHGKYTEPYDPNMLFGMIDISKMRRSFVNEITECFNSLYFEMAPLLCIPLYQTTEAGDFNVTEHYRNVSDYDAEAMANSMNSKLFMPEGSDTPQILKVTYQRTVGKTDFFKVDSFAFKKVPQVEFVTVMGGDGLPHEVPVPWFRYDPLHKESAIGARKFTGNKFQYQNLVRDEEFKKDKVMSRTNTRNHNFLGFYAPSDYNYVKAQDERVSSLINKYLDINRKVD